MDAPTITIQVNLSREGLLQLRDAIDALLEEGSKEAPVGLGALLIQRNADRKVTEVWSRVGENVKAFLATAAQRAEAGEEFTMNDVARWMKRDPKTVRSWHRNLGRTLKHVDAAIPEPLLLEARWDGQRNVYRFPTVIRDAILQRDMDPSAEPAH